MWVRAALVGRALSRGIATSGKRSDNAAVAGTHAPTKPTQPLKLEPPPLVETDDNWVSYGFSIDNRTDDRNYMHSIFFFSICVGLIGSGFMLAYKPDGSLRDWACREAYLELRRREAAGLPLISRDLIDPALIELPSDEELADTDIII